MSRRRSAEALGHSMISSIVRPQPRHQPVAESSVQTWLHGDWIVSRWVS